MFPLFLYRGFQEGLWKDTSFEDPVLQSLSSRLQATVLIARAPGTVNMYDRAFRKWKEFALRKKELSYYPVNPMHVAPLWILLFIVSSGLTSQRVLVNRVRDAAKRILGTKRGNRKEPLSVEILKDIIDGSDLSNTLQLRNVCLYVLCYAGLFRSGEVTRIRRRHIKFLEDHMIIKVEKRKLISLGKGMKLLSRVRGVALVQFSFFNSI